MLHIAKFYVNGKFDAKACQEWLDKNMPGTKVVCVEPGVHTFEKMALSSNG
jgi:hypothetical protein